MRIGIDARMYGPKARGLGRYIQYLVDNLAKTDQENEYYIFLGPHNWDDFQTNNSHFFKVLVHAHWYTISEQLLFPIILWRSNLDVMHFPHFNVPLLYWRRFVVTIHDLIISHYPDSRATTLSSWLYYFKILAYKLILSAAIIRSDKIIAVSQYTKNDIVSYYPKADHKIQVIYEGYSVDSQNTVNVDLEKKYNITKPYILYVGAAYPHKNLYRLIQAWKLIQKKLNYNYQLVLVGKKDYFYQRLIEDIKYHDLNHNVIFTDYVEDQELPFFYRFCLAYTFPSYLEGFGLPALEAQSYGAPVLAADNSCLPEILGQSALYFNPYDIQDIGDKIISIIQDSNLRAELINKGYQNHQNYNWLSMTKQTQNIYLDVFKHLSK